MTFKSAVCSTWFVFIKLKVKTYFVFGRKMSKNPAIMKMTRTAHNMPKDTIINVILILLKNQPPQTVKSILVWKAKMVRQKVTPAVIPTAMRTASTS